MVDINQTLPRNSIYGLATYGQEFYIQNSENTKDGIYYTKIFKKDSNSIWHKVSWIDNQIRTGFQNTLQNMTIEVRTRTGNELPFKDFSTNTRYTLEELNDIIESQNINNIDTIIERATLNRSIIASVDSTSVTSNDINYENLGTSYNSFRITNDETTIWNYWSLPIINSPSYIPDNRDYNYLQARIWLKSRDLITIPKMFRINFTSILSTFHN